MPEAGSAVLDPFFDDEAVGRTPGARLDAVVDDAQRQIDRARQVGATTLALTPAGRRGLRRLGLAPPAG